MIVIDAGHGGTDSGVTRPGLVEKTYALRLAQQVGLILRHADIPMELTRHEDEALTLTQRAAVANTGTVPPAELFISLHVNASPEPTTRGMICFRKPEDPIAGLVAISIADRAPEIIKRTRNAVITTSPHNWTKRANNVLRRVKCPAILVEVAHCTNETDLDYMISPYSIPAIAATIVTGVCAYMYNREGLLGEIDAV